MLFSSKPKFHQLAFVGAFLLLAILITGCEPEVIKNVGVAPTVASEYQIPTAEATPTRLPTLTPIANATPTRELPLKTVVIFDDGFQNGWRMLTEDVFAELTEEVIYDGEMSIKVSPRIDASSIYIVSSPESRVPIRKDDIVTVSFYLNGGAAPIEFDSMTITAQGSNVSPFWNKDDRSAITSSGAVFERTQLAFLGITTIPANTWGRIEFLPQEQIFDPVYDNFTGFYLSSYSFELAPYYIDRIEILLVDK